MMINAELSFEKYEDGKITIGVSDPEGRFEKATFDLDWGKPEIIKNIAPIVLPNRTGEGFPHREAQDLRIGYRLSGDDFGFPGLNRNLSLSGERDWKSMGRLSSKYQLNSRPFVITNRMMYELGLTEEELFLATYCHKDGNLVDSGVNLVRLADWDSHRFEDSATEVIYPALLDMREAYLGESEFPAGTELFVANTDNLFAAGGMDEAASQARGDFFLLPFSQNISLLIAPPSPNTEGAGIDPAKINLLARMLAFREEKFCEKLKGYRLEKIHNRELEREEPLSDHAYFYECETHELSAAIGKKETAEKEASRWQQTSRHKGR